MELLHLQYFCKIAQHENVTRAAQELHVAQSALSRVLKHLETELGVPLFARVGRQIVLNDNGRIVYRYAQRMMGELSDMQRELRDENHLGGTDTITFVVKVASKFLPQMLSGFRNVMPHVRFIIIQNRNDPRSFSEDSWDLCLDATMKPVEAEHSQCVLKEEICLVMPKNHPLAKRKSIRLEEVAGESFLGMQKGSSMNEIAVALCHRAGFSPHFVLESDNPGTMRELMRLGLGIAFNPVITWKEVSEDDFCLVPIDGMECCRYIYLSVRPEAYHSKAVRAFRDYLVAFFHDLQQETTHRL